MASKEARLAAVAAGESKLWRSRETTLTETPQHQSQQGKVRAQWPLNSNPKKDVSRSWVGPAPLPCKNTRTFPKELWSLRSCTVHGVLQFTTKLGSCQNHVKQLTLFKQYVYKGQGCNVSSPFLHSQETSPLPCDGSRYQGNVIPIPGKACLGLESSSGTRNSYRKTDVVLE